MIGLTGQSAFLTAGRLPRPGETVSCDSLFFEPGGKGHNQAIACARMGVETVFIGALGRDANGEACRQALEREGITACLIPKEEPTAFAAITTDGEGENVVQVYPGAAGTLTPEELSGEAVRRAAEGSDWFLLQNELPAACLEASLRLAAACGSRVILNPAPAKGLTEAILEQCDIITPNYGEAKLLAGFSEGERPGDGALCRGLCRGGQGTALVTLGSEGILLIRDGACRRMQAFSCGRTVDTTGAGDTFNGVFAAMLASGKEPEEAAEIALVAAGISVTRQGAAGSIPTEAQVREGMRRRDFSGPAQTATPEPVRVSDL